MEFEEQKKYLKVLKKELIPAMGCTEPIAVAYTAAICGKYLEKNAERMVVACSSNIIKNAGSAFVPHTGGRKGIQAAAAAGLLAGNPDKKLEVLAELTDRDVERIDGFCKANLCTVKRIDSDHLLHILVTVSNSEETVTAEVIDAHTNLIRVSKNGNIVFEKDSQFKEETEDIDDRFLTVNGILQFCESVNISEIKELIDKQINYNMAIAKEGLSGKYGVAIARCYDQNNILQKMKAYTAAASEARMSGCELPVVINSGSGNQGIAVSVPVIVYAYEMGVEKNELYRALVLSNLLAIHQKTGIGKLSAFCGAVSATCASGAAISYLRTKGDWGAVRRTIKNTLANTSGIICDGAKPSCAAKITSGLEGAMLGCRLSENHREYCANDGIVKYTVEDTIDAVARIARIGMAETDKVVFDVLLEKSER